MSETKDQIAADRDRLRAELEQAQARLRALGQPADAPGAQGPARLFLSEGNRQDLELHGSTVIGGRAYTREQLLAELEGGPQADVEIAEPSTTSTLPPVPPATNIRGFDYVYPSVARGLIDPKVAGTPGINGPAATTADLTPAAAVAAPDADVE